MTAHNGVSDQDPDGTHLRTVEECFKTVEGSKLQCVISHTSYTELRPYAQYCVRVTAHNGVSDQDPDGTHLRTVEKCVRTDEGRKL